MGLIVQKFGGSSVADAAKIRNVAHIITDTYKKGHSVVAVVSAQGGTTDELIAKAAEINPDASPREMDMLLSTGEQASCALCAMAVEVLGYPVVSLTGRQAGIQSDDQYGDANIQSIDTTRLLSELEKKQIVIVAGFQGEDKQGNITTLGRGGSDTSAVALAAALNAQLCQIYTDVDGVYTADPRIIPDAIKLSEITYEEMLELAHHGAKVLHDRSVALAKQGSVSLEVLSSFSGTPGTKINSSKKQESGNTVAGITQEDGAIITLSGIDCTEGILSCIAELLNRNGMTADLTIQAAGPTILLGVCRKNLSKTLDLLNTDNDICFTTVETTDTLQCISIVGENIGLYPSITEKVTKLLKSSDIQINMMSLDRSRISLFIAESDGIEMLRLLHQALF